jgi:hypothetical protein
MNVAMYPDIERVAARILHLMSSLATQYSWKIPVPTMYNKKIGMKPISMVTTMGARIKRQTPSVISVG